MKPLFTLHAGEVLAAEHIEREFKNVNVWIPTKDTGVDFLVSNRLNTKSTSLQIKYSKDFLAGFKDTDLNIESQRNLRACGWFSLSRKQLNNPAADYWVLVLLGFDRSRSFVVIKRTELLTRLDDIHEEESEICHAHIWVTRNGQCWETRGLKKDDKTLAANGELKNKKRNFSAYLDKWSPIEKLNGITNS